MAASVLERNPRNFVLNRVQAIMRINSYKSFNFLFDKQIIKDMDRKDRIYII